MVAFSVDEIKEDREPRQHNGMLYSGSIKAPNNGDVGIG